MQSLLGGPRSDLSEAIVLEALAYAAGGKIDWDVDVETAAGVQLKDGRIVIKNGVLTLRSFEEYANVFEMDLEFVPGSTYSRAVFWPSDRLIYSSVDNGATWTQVSPGGAILGFDTMAGVTTDQHILIRFGPVSTVGDTSLLDLVNGSLISVTGAGAGAGSYVLEPGTSGNNVSSPYVTGYAPSGDMTVAMYVAPDDWTPAAETAFASLYDSASDGAWICTLLTSGFLRLSAVVGGVVTSASCTIAPPGVVDGVGQWLQFSRQASDGTCDFKYNQTDGSDADPQSITWTNIQINRAGVAGTLDIPATADLQIGGRLGGATAPLAGKMYRTCLYDAITPAAGVLKFSMNPTDWSAGGTWVSVLTGETWTINGTASIVDPAGGSLTDQGLVCLNSVNSGAQQLAAATVAMDSPTQSGKWRAYLRFSMNDWTPGTQQTIAAWADGANTVIWRFSVSGTNFVFDYYDTTATFSQFTTPTASAAFPLVDGSKTWLMWELDNTPETGSVLRLRQAKDSFIPPAYESSEWTTVVATTFLTEFYLPSTVTSGSTRKMYFGGYDDAANDPLQGKIASVLTEHVSQPPFGRARWPVMHQELLPTFEAGMFFSSEYSAFDWIFPPGVESTTPLSHAQFIQGTSPDLDGYVEIQVGEPLLVSDLSVRWAFRPPSVLETTTETSAIRRTGTMSVKGELPAWFNPMAVRIRPYVELIAPSTLDVVRFYVGTFLMTQSPVTDDGVVLSHDYYLADLTFRLAGRLLREPLQWETVTPALTQVVAHINAEYPSEFAFVLPEAAYQTKQLSQELFYEANETLLVAYNGALGAIGLEPVVMNEDGDIVFTASADEAAKASEWSYGSGTTVLEGGTLEPLMPEIPNVIEFVSTQPGPSLPTEGNGLVTVYNLSVGPTSVNARGEQVYLRQAVDADSQEELEAHAVADSEYLFSGGGNRMSVRVLLNPLHSNRDVVLLTKLRFDIDGTAWNVVEWSYNLKPVTSPEDVSMTLVLEQRIQAGLTWQQVLDTYGTWASVLDAGSWLDLLGA